MAMSHHVSKAYLDAGVECAALNPSSVCQSKRLAAKLQNEMQHINYATIDMSAVYERTSTSSSSWPSVEVESTTTAGIIAACVLAFAVLRTQRRRSGYVGIPQASGTTEAAPAAINWPWYTSSN
ncbi:hypothetical protein H310_03598 [Aphanomyces invadans]|uniref:Uncharacterized protein n=2 Tax=Aphanomyces invadans TaxID=157072 RepID=A0A024UI75_9STRA|nr:hypothetical protein H310_03598 [Aphanomyces invadans]ETW05974.1 hypothetical protein H310_03598 [Aphanomyces invadans]|eukprot:XP_008865751.1 hypothetical protein H310_03598 [Aphanomyces invadans]